MNLLKNKKLLIRATLLALFSVTTFYALMSRPFWDGNVKWRDLETSVKIGGLSYVFDNGKILKDNKELVFFDYLNPLELLNGNRAIKLAIFVQEAKEEPLFTSPSLDADRLLSSVNFLEEEQKKILELVKGKDNFLPISFLEKVGQVKKEEAKLFEIHTIENAIKLLKAYEETHKAYQEAAKNLKDKVSSLESEKNYNQLASSANKEIVESDIKAILENSKVLEKEILSRANGLSWSGYNQRKIFEETGKPSISSQNNDSQLEKELLSVEEVYFIKEREALKIRGPYEVSSPCWSGDASQKDYLIYQTESEEGGRKYYFPKIATNNYYQKIGENDSDILGKAYKKFGISWRPIIETNSYQCNNLEYQAKLANLDFFYETYKGKIIYETLSLEKFTADFQSVVDQGRVLEDSFFSSPFPRDRALEELGSYYKYTYQYLLKNNINDSGDLKKELLNRYLIIEGNLGNLDYTLNAFAFFLNFHEKTTQVNNAQRGTDSVGKDYKTYIYLIRNGYSLLYLNFSPSVWVSEGRLKYLDSFKGNKVLTSYRDLIKEIGSPEVSKINNTKRELLYNYIDNLLK